MEGKLTCSIGAQVISSVNRRNLFNPQFATSDTYADTGVDRIKKSCFPPKGVEYLPGLWQPQVWE